MKVVVLTILFCLFSYALAVGQTNSGWNGIVPLETTRSEVARLLGEPKFVRKNSDLFFRPEEKVSIQYASGRCKGLSPHWNVKSGTVTSILVIAMNPVPFDPAKLDKSFIRGPVNDDLSVEYFSADPGIKFVVSESGRLDLISFTPGKIAREKFVCK